MAAEPVHGGFKVQAIQVHRQINGATAAAALIPVHELHAGNGDRAQSRVPLCSVQGITLGAGGGQHGFERNRAQMVKPIAKVIGVHESVESVASFGRRLTHFFILMTWLFSVRRSTRAAVR